MEKYLPILKKTHLFKGIEDKDIVTLLSCLKANIHQYKKGEYVLRQGDYLNNLAIVLEGSLHIQNDDYWGNRSILGVISKGEIFGEAYAFSSEEALLNDVVSIEDSSIMLINPKKIMSICSSSCSFHSKVIENLFYVFSEKNRKLVRKLRHISKRSIREKLMSYLSEQARKQNDPNIIIPFNRQQLAYFLSADRSALSNELSKMRDKGLIKYHKNKFTLL